MIIDECAAWSDEGPEAPLLDWVIWNKILVKERDPDDWTFVVVKQREGPVLATEVDGA